MSQTLVITLFVVALSVIGGLSFYAGRLLWQLKQQTQKREKVRQGRIDTITQSIQVIAKAMEQQQCDLSEGCIRLYNLLNALPLKTPPNYAAAYPNVFMLYEKVAHMPTHKARDALPKRERMKQDLQRAEWEAQLETAIMREVSQLKTFNLN